MPPPHLLKLWFVGFFSFAKCLYWCQAMPTVSPSRRASKRGRWQFESDTATDLVDGLPPAMGAPQDRETKPERSQSVCSGKASARGLRRKEGGRWAHEKSPPVGRRPLGGAFASKRLRLIGLTENFYFFAGSAVPILRALMPLYFIGLHT